MIDGKPLEFAKGESLDSFPIETILSNVSSIDATPADPNRKVTPDATITVTDKKGKQFVFDVALDKDKDAYWVKRHDLDRATEVDKAKLEETVEVDRDKLIKKPSSTDAPSTPAPGAPGAPGGATMMPPPVPPPAHP